MSSEKRILITYFFDKTGDEVRQLFQAAGIDFAETKQGQSLKAGFNLCSAFELTESHNHADQVIAMEAHPVYSINRKIAEIFIDTDLDAITFYMGMDEPLMQVFGTERIVSLMERMGMQEEEEIAHQMVDKSIERAQKKLEEKGGAANEVSTSQEDWIASFNNL